MTCREDKCLAKDKVKEILHEQLDFGTYEVNICNYKENKFRLLLVMNHWILQSAIMLRSQSNAYFIVPT